MPQPIGPCPVVRQPWAAPDQLGPLQVDAWIAAAGYDLSEAEFALLLQAYAHDGSPDRGLQVLQRMTRELMCLTRGTLAAAAAFFR